LIFFDFFFFPISIPFFFSISLFSSLVFAHCYFFLISNSPIHLPHSHFAAHVRSHFFCNIGVAAGLLLTRSLGGGVFAADRVVGRKKSR